MVYDITKIYADMVKTAATDKPKITEDEFVKHLLPRLVNIEALEDLDMTIWLEIAGNAHREIDVIDRQGKLLFTIPPLLARTPSLMPERERTDMSVGEILAIYGAKQVSDHPAAADVYLTHALRNQVFGPDEQQLFGYLKTWVDIYTRYSIPTTRLLGNYTVKKDEEKKTESPDDLTGDLLDF